MNIEARKYHMIEQIMRFDEAELAGMEAFLEERVIDPQVEKELIARALQSERDIKEGRVYNIDEAEQRINRRLGL